MSGPPATVAVARRRGRPAAPARMVAFAFAVAFTTTLAVAPATLAADPVFGTATATSVYGEGITLTQPVTMPAGVARVEAVVREGIGARTFLATVATPAPGATTLRYVQDTPKGGLFPNTPVQLGFRLTFDDGHSVDGPTITHLYADDRYQWRTLQGTVVRIHWTEGDAAFGRHLLDVGEQAIKNATSLLGVQETAPIDFFVYADRAAFYDVIGAGVQENVGGLALPDIRTLFANIGSGNADDPWVGVVVPHELTHIVFGTATHNAYHEPLHWLNEGLADYLAQGYDAGARANVESAARSGDLMPLSALVQQFPASADRFSLAYDESVSAIDYLIRTHGKNALVHLIRSYADGVSDDEAFKAALGVDTAAFEAAWLADLGIQAPVPYGPQPAPVGPLPPGWAAAPGASAGPGTSPTTRPATSGGSDLAEPILWVGLGLVALVIVAGILFVARALSRGDPLLPVAAGTVAPLNEPAMPEQPATPAEPAPAELVQPGPPGPTDPARP